MRMYGYHRICRYDTEPVMKAARAYEGQVADEVIEAGIEDWESRPCSAEIRLQECDAGRCPWGCCAP